jgi:hypothetical protein
MRTVYQGLVLRLVVLKKAGVRKKKLYSQQQNSQRNGNEPANER